MTAPLFTVFVPTFNRAAVLPRALDSISRQSFRDFDVVIVDDGSVDNTAQLVEQWSEASDFKVHYVRQENQGKHAAHNTALKYLDGELTVLLDSDDMLTPDALQVLADEWQSIEDKSRFAGIEGNVTHLNGSLEGNPFPQDRLDCSLRDLRLKHHVRGDKRGATRTDILRQFPYPVFPGERHIKPSVIQNQIARQYIYRYINKILQIKEHQPGGLSDNRFRLRMNNPRGFRECYLQEITLYDDNRDFKNLKHNYLNYLRYSFHGHVPLKTALADIGFSIWALLFLPMAYVKYMTDRGRLRKQQNKSL